MVAAALILCKIGYASLSLSDDVWCSGVCGWKLWPKQVDSGGSPCTKPVLVFNVCRQLRCMAVVHVSNTVHGTPLGFLHLVA